MIAPFFADRFTFDPKFFVALLSGAPVIIKGLQFHEVPARKLFDLYTYLEYLKLYLQFEGEDLATQHFHPGDRSRQMESGRQFLHTDTSGMVLEEIAAKCGFKVTSCY
jgi:hypothetical protein